MRHDFDDVWHRGKSTATFGGATLIKRADDDAVLADGFYVVDVERELVVTREDSYRDALVFAEGYDEAEQTLRELPADERFPSVET